MLGRVACAVEDIWTGLGKERKERFEEPVVVTARSGFTVACLGSGRDTPLIMATVTRNRAAMIFNNSTIYMRTYSVTAMLEN